jgi:hypothetical protein
MENDADPRFEIPPVRAATVAGDLYNSCAYLRRPTSRHPGRLSNQESFYCH